MGYSVSGAEQRCIMETERLGDRWRHRCIKCGAVRDSVRPRYAKRCARAGRGLGSRISAALKLFGITPALVSRLLGRPCKCNRRREALDRLVPWL